MTEAMRHNLPKDSVESEAQFLRRVLRAARERIAELERENEVLKSLNSAWLRNAQPKGARIESAN